MDRKKPFIIVVLLLLLLGISSYAYTRDDSDKKLSDEKNQIIDKDDKDNTDNEEENNDGGLLAPIINNNVNNNPQQVVKKAPDFDLDNITTREVELGDEFELPKKTITDVDGKKLEAVITYLFRATESDEFISVEKFDTSIMGQYKAVYTITNKDELSTSKSIIITIVDTTLPIIEGIDNNTITNNNVILTITELNEYATSLNGYDYISGSEITENGSYTLEVVDKANNKASLSFVIDKEAPKATINVTPNRFTKEKVLVTIISTEEIKKIEGFTKVDEYTYTKEYSENIIEEVVLEDLAGNTSIISVNITNIDKIKPTINNIINNSYYNENVVINVTDDKKLDKIFLNDNLVENNTIIENEGTYVVKAIDEALNEVEVTFTIDKTKPVITGVENNGYYNDKVTISVTDNQKLDKIFLNGNLVGNNIVIEEAGTYIIKAIDMAFNETEITITIDKTLPTAVVNYSNANGWTNGNVIVTIIPNESIKDILGFKKIDNSYVKEYNTIITESITIEDLAGNTSEIMINVTNIDKILPTINPTINMNNSYSATISANATDLESGIKEIKYAHGIITDSNYFVNNGTIMNNESVVKTNGTYTIYAIDNAGNKALSQVVVTGLGITDEAVKVTISDQYTYQEVPKYARTLKFDATYGYEITSIRYAQRRNMPATYLNFDNFESKAATIYHKTAGETFEIRDMTAQKYVIIVTVKNGEGANATYKEFLYQLELNVLGSKFKLADTRTFN